MRVLSTCILVILSCSAAYAAKEEFPAKVRGLWTDTIQTCDELQTVDPAFLPAKRSKKWLKLTATNVLGSTQGRLLRAIPAQMIDGVAAELSFELQALDDPGTIVGLSMSTDGRLHETIGGTSFLPCASALAGNTEFPQKIRGVWTDKKSTCDVLRTKGPAHLRNDQFWLKIAAADVLGSSQGRILRERRPAHLFVGQPEELSFEIQLLEVPAPEFPLLADLTLSVDGRLHEAIVGARAAATYQRCQSVLPRGKNP
jgi:hypothetical protein